MTILVDAQEHQDVARGERGMTILLPGELTGDAVALLEATMPAGTAGPPRHRHPASDETFLVLEGALLLATGDEVHRIPTGGVAFVRRGDVHAFATPLDSGARFLAVHTPGGFERFHIAAAEAARQQGRLLDRDELAAIAVRFDWAPAGPPLDPATAPAD